MGAWCLENLENYFSIVNLLWSGFCSALGLSFMGFLIRDLAWRWKHTGEINSFFINWVSSFLRMVVWE